MELKENKNFYILLLIAFTFVIAAIVSTIFTSKVSDIKKEQLKLIRANILLSKEIESKKIEYEKIQDKIEDIEESIGSGGVKNSNIKKLLTHLDNKTKKLIIKSIPAGYPSSSRRVTSAFGYRIHPIYNEKRFHHGIDFGGKIGTPIKATADGIVEFSGYNKGYGNLVVISHNFGFKTAYGHMLEKLMVKKGDFVKKGDIIGYLGNSGISTGPHLHYEIKYIKNLLDPKNFFKLTTDSFNDLLYKEKKISWEGLIKAIMSQYQKRLS